MASEPKRAVKTDILSMRIDPKTRFAIEVLSRFKGQSISTVVERAILEVADRTIIGNDSKTWRAHWSVTDGARELSIALDQNLFPTYEEEKCLEFAHLHWQFFYSTSDLRYFKISTIDIIWPRIEEILEVWERTRSSDRWAAGRLMHKIISDAGVKAPDWPPQPAEKPAAKVAPSGPSWEKGKGGSDLDDEIPF